jgi:2-oxoisovalerate dehydrogenase E1 component
MRAHTVPVEGEDAGIDLSGVDPADAREWLAGMLLIREFESTAGPLATSGEIPGGMHAATGQEAVAVGITSVLGPDDVAAASHRSHHVALAKGMAPRSVMAELFGKATGCAGGRGGHMHLADFSVGFDGSNGIVGAGLGIALGASFAQGYRQDGHCAAGFFGDGGANTGRVWEFVNLAAAWKLPLIAVCENNGYAVETPINAAMAGESVASRAAGFGLPAVQVDGQDVAALHRAAAEAADRARNGGGPTFIEALTYRHLGHDIGERGQYRTTEEVEWWQTNRDPINRMRVALEKSGDLDEAGFADLAAQATARVKDAVEYAQSSPLPDPATVADGVTSVPLTASKRTTLSRAYRDGLAEEMARDDSIVVLGTDLYERGGHWAQVTNLGPQFGRDRVRNAPISEAAMVAAGVGAAMNGLRPVVDLNFLDFAFGAMDEIVNQAAKIRYWWGRPVPLVVRGTTGFAGGGAQHNNPIESWFGHVPGLLMAYPSTPYDAKGLIKSAMRGEDPVIFAMHKMQTGTRGEAGGPDDLVPFGQAVIRRPGRDVTVVSYGVMAPKALAAAERLAADGIEAEVIDLRTLAPLDLGLVEESVRRTRTLVVAAEDYRHGGIGAEIAASMQESLFGELDAPVLRIGAPFAPVPHSPVLLEALTPGADDVERLAREAVKTASGGHQR